MAKRKRNFTDTELEVLVGEVEMNQTVLFGTLNAGVTNKRKNDMWEKVAAAVSAVGSEDRSPTEIKKKWFHIKLRAKNTLQPTERKRLQPEGDKQVPPSCPPWTHALPASSGTRHYVASYLVETQTRSPHNHLYHQPVTAETQPSPTCPQESDAADVLGELEEQERPGPSNPQSVRPGGARVLTEAVLQNQRDTTNAIIEMRDQLTTISNTLLQMNEALQLIAACASQTLNK